METYNFIYTVDGIECQCDINANSEESAWNTIKEIIPSATNIVLI